MRLAAIAVGVVAFLAALAGLDARATYGTRVTADEPQYLLTATSIGEDLSLDISDEIARRRFAEYHELDLNGQTMVLDDAGREVSPHDPLLPAILALPMRVGGWQAPKATLAVIAGLTAALTTWVAVRRVRVGVAAAAVAVGGAFAGIPLAPYGTQVYPEMPAALAVMGALALLTAPRPTWATRLGALAAIVALPWLAVKYVPVAAVLGVALLWSVRRERRVLTSVAGVAALGGLTYLVAHRAWYGGWTVYATGDHFAETGEFSAVGTRVDVLGRSRRLAGLLVDRDFGLAAWSPMWFLAPLGLGMLVARPWRGRWVALAIVAAGWLNATFVALTMHGWWVPGRQVVVVAPVAVLGLAVVAARTRWLLALVAGLGVLGAVNWLWLAWESSTGRRTLVVDFFETAAWPYRAVRALLPDGLHADGASTAVLAAWAVVLVALFVIGYRTARSECCPPDARAPARTEGGVTDLAGEEDQDRDKSSVASRRPWSGPRATTRRTRP